jgi:hypothetical protein
MDLKTAYDKAAKLHPEISKIIAQREAAAAAAAQTAAAVTRRRAASSVTNQTLQQTGEVNNKGNSIRSDIEVAIQRLSN